jgi:hypothetical protein
MVRVDPDAVKEPFKRDEAGAWWVGISVAVALYLGCF